MKLEKIEALEDLVENINKKYSELAEYGADTDIKLENVYNKSFKEFEHLALEILDEEQLPISFVQLPAIAQRTLKRNDIINKSILDEYVAKAGSLFNAVLTKAENTGAIPSIKKTIDSTDILIVVPLEEEINEFKKIFSCADRPHKKGNSKLYFSTINGNNVTILQPNNMGQTDATAAAASLIESSRPDFIFVSGIAAGFKKNPQSLGDVIIPEMILQYDRIRLVEDITCPDTGKIKTETKAYSKQYLASDMLYKSVDDFVSHSKDYEKWRSDNLNEKINNADFSVAPSVFLGETLASADEVQTSENRIKELSKANRKLIGQDMESAGVFVASTYCDHNPEIITVRGISDWGKNKTKLEHDTSGKVRTEAAIRAASFIHYYLMSLDFNKIKKIKGVGD